MRVALDAMGGDLAPKATVEGAVRAARDFGAEVVLVGDREVLKQELAQYGRAGLKLSVEHADEVVAMDESPLESVLAKPNSSIHVGFELVRRREVAAFVSAGNSGAVMAAGMAILGTLTGVDRPAIASLVPTAGGLALLVDAGANTEVKPLNLAQFTLLGAAYCRRVRQIAKPRVGILSNGEEPSKGNELTRAAAALVAQFDRAGFSYIGYVEGRDINHGKADVVVTDGFTGNVVLKTMEGFAGFLQANLREVFSSSAAGRLAYLLVRRRLRLMRTKVDPSEYGGAPLLGLNGVAIVAHGASTGWAIRNAIRACSPEAVQQANADVVELLSRRPSLTVPAKAGGKGLKGILGRVRERLHRHARDSRDGKEPHATPAHPQSGVNADHSAASAEHDQTKTGAAAPEGSAAQPNGRSTAGERSGSGAERKRSAGRSEPSAAPQREH